MAIELFQRFSVNLPRTPGLRRNPQGYAAKRDHERYRPAESSASSATYGVPSRQAVTCSGRPYSAR
jgi:hypothetical protein